MTQEVSIEPYGSWSTLVTSEMVVGRVVGHMGSTASERRSLPS